MNRVMRFMQIISCFLLTGCAAPVVFFGAGAAAGVVGYKYYEGALTVIFQSPFMETWDATLTALDRMNIKVESSTHDITSGKVRAKRGEKQPVTISLKYKSAKETEVVIKVGYLGDESASMAIKEEIRKVLFNV
jgi:uncharacterized lipoprotein